METKIKEVQDYFIAKIVAGDYEIQKLDTYEIKILIDDKYQFSIWIANGAEYFRTHKANFNFVDVDFTEDQKEQGFEVVNAKIREYKACLIKAEIQELETKIETLKKSLQNG